jgi:prepilin-type processing-associated H-X9-DG protein
MSGVNCRVGAAGTAQRAIPTTVNFGKCRRPAAGGFTRLDLLVLIGLAVLGAAWLGLGRIGERGRRAGCAANLEVLGQAMQGFGNDHGDALPPASVEPQRLAWDAQIAPYLPRNLVQNGIDPLFRCPSDRLAHARARSYTMSAHDMQPGNWPPGPDNTTGVGLVWTRDNLGRLLGEPAAGLAATNADFLAMVKRSFIRSPADTLVLTELINADNNLKDTRLAAISGSGPQLELLLQHHPRIHGGFFNYLMLDGHVERVSPLQAGTTAGGRNIWNINPAN